MKRQKTSTRFRIYKAARKCLASAYPAAFPPRGRRPPLKCGILRDIVERGAGGLSATHVRIFLQVWTSSTAYLSSVSRGGGRIGLDGTCDGFVEESHAGEAAAMVAERRERIRSKRLTDSRAACSDVVNK